ncbi:MAG: hypothetical protein ABWY33_03350 [Cellulomonas sp.]
MAEPADDGRLALNGVDSATGGYLTPEVDLAGLAASVRGGPPGASRALTRRRRADEDHLGVAFGFDPDDLSSVGWGLVVPDGLDPAVLEALEPLVALRRAEAGDRFRRLDLRPGETADELLARYGMPGPSVVDPRTVPYYLLVVGTPAQVPFDVQYALGVSYAVGRLDLPDPAAVAAYCAHVVAAEHRAWARPGTVHVFATRHASDVPTTLSATRLAQPVADDLVDVGVTVGTDIGATASRSRLMELLTADAAPDVLFTASHGLGGARPAARLTNGALVCQDWPGPLAADGPPSGDQYVDAESLTTPTRVGVVVAFGCSSAATPAPVDDPGAPSPPGTPFTAALPQRLLPAGTLAFVGHVGRTWSCSFLWTGMAGQVTPFTSTLHAAAGGVRIGQAMEALTSRYAQVATQLTDRLDAQQRRGLVVPDDELVGLWTALRDARSSVLLGDPAVRATPRAPTQQSRP